MKQSQRHAHQKILITGTSSGFGMHMAHRLAKDHQVYATMRNLTKKDKLETKLRNSGCTATLLQLDVTDPVSILEAYKKIADGSDHIDVIINNAGFAIGGLFEDTSCEEIAHLMNTNFYGAVNVTKQFLPHLKRSCKPKIINISSMAGLSGTPFLSGYSASKWALEGLSEALRIELESYNIQVTLIEPGMYKTGMYQRNNMAKKAMSASSLNFNKTQKIIEQLETFAEKAQNPDDIAKCVEKLIRKKKLALRYVLGRDAKLEMLIKKLFPRRVYELLLKRYILLE